MKSFRLPVVTKTDKKRDEGKRRKRKGKVRSKITGHEKRGTRHTRTHTAHPYTHGTLDAHQTREFPSVRFDDSQALTLGQAASARTHASPPGAHTLIPANQLD